MKLLSLLQLLVVYGVVNAEPIAKVELAPPQDPNGIGSADFEFCSLPSKLAFRIFNLVAEAESSEDADCHWAAFHYINGYRLEACQNESGNTLFQSEWFSNKWTKSGIEDATGKLYGYAQEGEVRPLAKLGFVKVEFSGKIFLEGAKMVAFTPEDRKEKWLVFLSREDEEDLLRKLEQANWRSLPVNLIGQLGPVEKFVAPKEAAVFNRFIVGSAIVFDAEK